MYEIYLITNQINGKMYVGQATLGLKRRLRRHINDAKGGSNLHLHRAMRKYGYDRFTVSLLATAKDKEDLNRLETFWIKWLKSKDREFGYNMTEGGEGCAGAVQGPESRAKKSKSLMGVHTGKFVGDKGWRFRHDLETGKLVDMYHSGKGTGEIGHLVGASKETVTSRLIAAGVRFRSNSEAQKIRSADPNNLPCYRADVSTDDMILMFEQGWSYQAIGNKLGCSKRCVVARLQKIGMSRSKAKPRPAKDGDSLPIAV